MKLVALTCCVLLHLAAASARAEAPAPAKAEAEPGSAAVSARQPFLEQALAELGAADFQTRERAMHALVALGPDILGWIQAARAFQEKNGDAEVRTRLSAIADLLKSEPVGLCIRAQDPGGKELAFAWRQVEGPEVKIGDPAAARRENGGWVSQTYFLPRQGGQYVFEVSVRNGDGLETRQRIAKDVSAERFRMLTVPESLAEKVGNELRINAAPANASDRLEYTWVCVEPADLLIPEPLAHNSSLVFCPKIARQYVFKVSATDSKGRVESAQCTVTVRP